MHNDLQPLDWDRQYVLRETVMRDTRGEGGRGGEREEAPFQPAVTLMTPFITMCRLTSWQSHAAPDGGEGPRAIPTLHSSFVAGQREGSPGWEEKERIAVVLVHSLTDTALAQLCKAALVLVLWQQEVYTMARPCHIKNVIAYYSACSRKTLNPTPVQPRNTPHRDVKRQKPSSEMLSYSMVEKFPDLKMIHWKNCEDIKNVLYKTLILYWWFSGSLQTC